MSGGRLGQDPESEPIRHIDIREVADEASKKAGELHDLYHRRKALLAKGENLDGGERLDLMKLEADMLGLLPQFMERHAVTVVSMKAIMATMKAVLRTLVDRGYNEGKMPEIADPASLIEWIKACVMHPLPNTVDAREAAKAVFHRVMPIANGLARADEEGGGDGLVMGASNGDLWVTAVATGPKAKILADWLDEHNDTKRQDWDDAEEER